jgi:hypothetical protein
MSETITVRVYVRTNKIGSECDTELEFDRDEWEAMSEQEREDACRDAVWNMAEWNYEVE